MTTPPRYAMFFPMVLIVFSPMGIDLFLPATQAVKTFFGISLAQSQWTISIFVLCLGLGQIPFGNVSDKRGRRPIAIFGLITFCFGSLLGLFAQSFEMFLGARFLQGIGASATTVAAFSIVRDFYTGDEASNKFSWLTAALNIVPSIAPMIGALLLSLWGWRAGFGFFFVTALFALFFLISRFKETATVGQDAQVSLGSFFMDTRLVLSVRESWVPALICITGLSFIISYLSLAPEVLMGKLGLSPIKFSVLFCLNAVIIMMSSFLVPRFNRAFGVLRMISIGLFLFLVSATMLLLCGLMGWVAVWYFFMIPVAVGSVGFAFSFGNAQGVAMTPHGALIGTASGVLGALQMSIASVVAAMIVSRDAGNLVVFGSIFTLLFFVLLSAWFVRTRFAKQISNA